MYSVFEIIYIYFGNPKSRAPQWSFVYVFVSDIFVTRTSAYHGTSPTCSLLPISRFSRALSCSFRRFFVNIIRPVPSCSCLLFLPLLISIISSLYSGSFLPPLRCLSLIFRFFFRALSRSPSRWASLAYSLLAYFFPFVSLSLLSSLYNIF